MNFILVSVGTDGDVFPYAGLGSVLRERGHRVTLVASGQYAPLAAAHGFEFRPLVSQEENRELLEDPGFWNPLKTAQISARWGNRFIGRQYDLLSELATPGDSVLVSNPGVLASSIVHEKSGRPLANLVLQPWMIRSTDAPPVMPLFGLARWPRPAVNFFWRLLDGVVDGLMGSHLNRVRVSVGLKPARRIFRNWLARQLVIGMFPEWYGPPQRDWLPQIRLVGFPRFDGVAAGATLPEELERFLAQGSPPVAFTFGTEMLHARELFKKCSEACVRAGKRGIFLTRYRQQLPDVFPADQNHCAFAPFQQLFPRCAGVVHHGGIGTTARALAAGRPQVVVPICFDQMDNAARVQSLGVGETVGRGRPVAEFAQALVRLTTMERVQQARDLAATRDFSTDAFGAAARLVEGLVGQA